MATSIINEREDNSEEPTLYQLIKLVCPTPCRAQGPEIDLEALCTNPDHQKECIDHLMTGSQQTFSNYISELMDRLGYSYKMIKLRQRMFFEGNMFQNRHFTPDTFYTGSKAEGTTLYYESDFDKMIVLNNVVCVDNSKHPICQNENITLFQAERCELFPGYTRLKLLTMRKKSKGSDALIRESLFESKNGTQYLSSRVFVKTTKNLERTCLMPFQELQARKGPSIPSSIDSANFDEVFSFKLFCRDILERWETRHRRHGWPSEDIINQISRLNGHVVPVGHKASPNQDKEWRICYTLAELHLMRTFNETQLKVYILLKKISKTVLHKVCEDMTSYVMKNIVFWISEKKGVEEFKPNLLMLRILDCLEYLRTCVIKKHLSSYMIPERNLLAGRVNFQSQQLESLLSDLLLEGNRMLLRCNKLHDALIVMYTTPDMLTDFGEKRDKIERPELTRHVFKDTGLTEIPNTESEEEVTKFLLQTGRYYPMSTHRVKFLHIDPHGLRKRGISEIEIQNLIRTKVKQILS